jgi:ABC-type dipeptide/oligopeptide/nickel transport system ATPase component
MALLEIENLSVDFPTTAGVMRAVDGVSFRLEEGEVLGIVGESGSGKSVTMLALMGLVAYPGQITADRLAFADQDLLTLSAGERRRLTGKDLAMIFQEPTTASTHASPSASSFRRRCGCMSGSTARRGAGAPSSCSNRSASRRRRAGCAPSRISSRAA